MVRNIPLEDGAPYITGAPYINRDRPVPTVEDELVDLERVCEEGTAVKEQQPREDQPGSAEQADDQLAGAREVDHLERALTRPADDWLAVTDGQAERGVEHAQNRAHL
jgi:hypothetical protein